MKTNNQYAKLPIKYNKDGKVRRVGFELEFAGITLANAVKVMLNSFDAQVNSSTQAQTTIQVNQLGDFVVEIDWLFLKNQAEAHKQKSQDDDWIGYLGEIATHVVPIEIVCPPIKWTDIYQLEPLINNLQKCGAQGTDSSLLAAYGLHINTEVVSLSAQPIFNTLKAFVLMQDWLIDFHQVDFSRRILPYIDLFEHDYIALLCSQESVSMAQLIDDYLEYNRSRNRALDMLPLFKHLNAVKVNTAIQDERIKSRPTFHYRLPDCQINHANWSLAQAWNGWCVVEKLANTPKALETLSTAYRQQRLGLTGVKHKEWREIVAACIQSHALV